MSHRVPSTSSAIPVSSRSSIRHRSGTFGSNAAVPQQSLQHSRRPSVSESSESSTSSRPREDEPDGPPQKSKKGTLERKVRVNARPRVRSQFRALPCLPFEDNESESSSSNLREGISHLLQDTPVVRGDDRGPRESPSSIPRLESTQSRRPNVEHADSVSSIHTDGVHSVVTSRLPTPNYSREPARANLDRQVSSYFSRIPSFRSRPAPPSRIETDMSAHSYMSDASTAVSHTSSTSPSPRSSRPLLTPAYSHSSDNYSHEYTADERSASTARVPTAIKDKRPLLVSRFSTADKFTQKFPRPRVKLSAGPAASILEEGAGLGMERVERWTLHKWCLVLSVCSVMAYGAVGLVCVLLTWFRAWPYADVMHVADIDILVLLTLSACIMLLTALVGLSGTLLNSRPLLAVYALLLWPAFFSLLAVGYPAYKRYAFALDRKLSRAWSEYYTPLGRRVLQDTLGCCGVYNALHDASPSGRCYARSPLPGCKRALWAVERANLAMVWSAVFALVPLHLVNVCVALLCANHVTKMFGKGIMPKRYRLNAEDVRSDAEVLLKALGGLRHVARPGFARAPTSGILREDKRSRDDCESY